MVLLSLEKFLFLNCAIFIMADQVNELREKVESKLPSLSVQDLAGVCTEIDLPVDDAKKGKKSALYRHLLTHLWGEGDKEDGGFPTFKIVDDYLTQLEKKGNTTDVKLKVEQGAVVEEDLGKSEVSLGSGDVKPKVLSQKTSNISEVKYRGGASVVEVQTRMQTFKINGVIGGDTNSITFDNLSFQIKNALEAGYNEPSICGAVIKAICPSNNLRVLFENGPKLGVESMLDMLRPYLVQNRDGASYYSELCSAKQRPPDKNAMDFLVRLLGLKNRVFRLSEEEGTPFDANLMRKQFFKTLFSGLKNVNIRAEIKESCKTMAGGDFLDKDLMEIVAEAMGNEALRAGNFTSSKEVNSVESCSISEDESRSSVQRKGKNKENLLPVQVDKQKQDIDVLKAEVSELKGQNKEMKSLLVANNKLLTAQAQVNSANAAPGGYLSGASGTGGFPGKPPQNTPGNFNNRKKNWPRKCPACHQNNVFRCYHCWECGSNDHKKGDPSCPGNH